ncbi:MAG: hypothetical protein LBQ93_11855 [Treponema sp.]|jgi:hypothetical protein|nr:hypothetical protein [Treponema sp.]
MKKKEKTMVLKKILLALGDDGLNFEIDNNVGDVAFVKPVGNCYRGICINASQLIKEEFCLQVFFDPLYIPTECVYFNIGWRLLDKRNYDSWTSESAEEIAIYLKQDALSKLLCSYTDEQLLKTIKDMSFVREDMFSLEAKVILAARIGDFETLQNEYKILKQREQYFPPGLAYFASTDTMMQNYQNRDFIIDITDKWKNESVQGLKLEKWVTQE